MDTNLIKTFISLAETKNFNKTAENLYISQPTVSMRIKQLEDELGQTLFDRDKRNVELTAAGYAYLQYANKIIMLLNESQISMRKYDDQMREIVFSAPVMTWDYGPLRSVMMDFIMKHQNISFHLLRADSYTTLNYFANHLIDLGITYLTPNRVNDMEIIPLFQEHLFLMAKKGSNIRAEGNNLFMPGGDPPCFVHLEYGTNATDHLVEDLFYGLPIFLKTDHLTLHFELVKNGLGVGLLPESIIKQSSNSAQLEIVDCDYNQHPLLYGNYLVYRKKADATLGGLIELIVEKMRSNSTF